MRRLSPGGKLVESGCEIGRTGEAKGDIDIYVDEELFGGTVFENKLFGSTVFENEGIGGKVAYQILILQHCDNTLPLCQKICYPLMVSNNKQNLFKSTNI